MFLKCWIRIFFCCSTLSCILWCLAINRVFHFQIQIILFVCFFYFWENYLCFECFKCIDYGFGTLAMFVARFLSLAEFVKLILVVLTYCCSRIIWKVLLCVFTIFLIVVLFVLYAEVMWVLDFKVHSRLPTIAIVP